jgi:hypothetical protein
LCICVCIIAITRPSIFLLFQPTLLQSTPIYCRQTKPKIAPLSQAMEMQEEPDRPRSANPDVEAQPLPSQLGLGGCLKAWIETSGFCDKNCLRVCVLLLVALCAMQVSQSIQMLTAEQASEVLQRVGLSGDQAAEAMKKALRKGLRFKNGSDSSFIMNIIESVISSKFSSASSPPCCTVCPPVEYGDFQGVGTHPPPTEES